MRQVNRKAKSLSMNSVSCIGLCAAAMLVVSQRPAADEGWRAVEQPELEQALEHAPLLQTESLGGIKGN